MKTLLGRTAGKVPNSVHEARSWVIAEIAPDFTLLDAWALPVEGSREDFGSLLEIASAFDPAKAGSAIASALFWIRFRLGDLFGWDDATKKRPIPGCREATLYVRLPEQLQGSAADSSVGDALEGAGGGFTPLYRTEDEWAAEISNETVHGVLHLSWIEQGNGRYRGQLAVYVKPRGVVGRMYLKLIEPFRHLIVYPALIRQIEREWRARYRKAAALEPEPHSM